jgi:hypothetical protein
VRGRPRVPLDVRLWSQVVVTDAGCWEWTGARSRRGYGSIGLGIGARVIRAHRAAWLLAHIVIPDGMQVLHSCDNPPCVNPSHLFLGTHQDNMDDKVRKGRQSRGAYHGHATVLTAADVPRIRGERAAGRTLRAIARDLGVAHNTVRNVLTDESWKHIP